MNIIVSKDKRVPPELRDDYNYEIWSLDEFYDRANRDDGLEFDEDEKLYINVEVLASDLYQALSSYSEVINIVYYRFSDQDIRISFNMDEEVVVYEETKEELENEDVSELLLVPYEDTTVEETVSEEVEEETQQELQEQPKEEIKEEVVEEIPITDESVAVVNNISVDLSKENIGDFTGLFENQLDETYDRSKPAKVYVFGSLKGGVGKSTTCLMTVHNFAKKNPQLRVAVCDLDLADGQVSPLINKFTPTIKSYYKRFKKNAIGQDDDEKEVLFKASSVQSVNFSPNVDFYLAPVKEESLLIKDLEFWKIVVEQLLKYYDVVFFDTGTEYLSTKVITNVYKLADKLILLSNTSTSSVRSVQKQLQVLSGELPDSKIFTKEDKMLEKTNIVMTRVSGNKDIINLATKYLKAYAKISAVFGNLESLIEAIQWYQRYNLIYDYPQVVKALDKVLD